MFKYGQDVHILLRYKHSIHKRGGIEMVCPKCGSDNIQIVQGDSRVRESGCLWSIGRGLLIICTLGLWKIIGRRKGKLKTKTLAVCVNCGHKWKI